MARQINLADPDDEPTDEELQQLSKDAFADTARRRAAAHERIRNEVATLRAEARAQRPTTSSTAEPP